MKIINLLTVLILIFSLFFFAGCSTVLSPLPVGFIGNATFPVDYEPGPNYDSSCVVIGEVEGKAIASSFLGLFASGDASIYSAYQNALNFYEDTDYLTEVSIDYNATTTLGIIATYTTIVHGKAVRRDIQKNQMFAVKKNVANEQPLKQVNTVTKLRDTNKVITNTKPVNDPLIGHWTLETTTLPNGNILDNKTGLKGSLVINAQRNVKLLFIQGERGVEFKGKYYNNSEGAIFIEVVQVDRANQNEKIIYKNVTLDNDYLIIMTESNRTYRWKKS